MVGGKLASCGFFGKTGWYFFKGVGFIVGTFIFSYIFWRTKNWLDNKSPKKRKK
jgi:hypothetical protein